MLPNFFKLLLALSLTFHGVDLERQFKKSYWITKSQYEFHAFIARLESSSVIGYSATLAKKERGKFVSGVVQLIYLTCPFTISWPVCRDRNQIADSWVVKGLLRNESWVKNWDLALILMRCISFEIHSALRL